MNNTQKLTSSLLGFQEEMQELEKTFKQKGSEGFKKQVDLFFNLYPDIKAISWLQYSPYFNDGEECVFYVHAVNALSFIPESIEYEYELEEDENGEETGFILGDYSIGKIPYNKEQEEAIFNFLKFIENETDLMEQLFGNHKQILITQEEIKVEDYNDHD